MIRKIMLAAAAVMTATSLQAAEKVGLTIRKPFDMGSISTVYVAAGPVHENETVFWARPDVLFVGKEATPCRIDWIPGDLGPDNKLIVCYLGMDNDWHPR